MAEQTVAVLSRKRAELAGEVEALRARAADLQADVAHLDAVIRLLDPGHAAEAIRAKWPDGPGLFAGGELTRLIYEALRGAEGPLDAGTVAARVMTAKGLDPGDRRLAGDVRDRVRRALGKQAGRVLRRVPLDEGRVGWLVA